jgi:hypothetical protein
VPVISLNTTQKLPIFNSKFDQSTSDIQSSTNQIVPPTLPFNPTSAGEPSPIINSQVHERGLSLTIKSPDDFDSVWNLDEINRFTREIFKHSIDNINYLI